MNCLLGEVLSNLPRNYHLFGCCNGRNRELHHQEKSCGMLFTPHNPVSGEPLLINLSTARNLRYQVIFNVKTTQVFSQEQR
jgi:hypothetical protein